MGYQDMSAEDLAAEDLAALIEKARTELIRRQNNALLDERLAEVQDEFREAKILPTMPTTWVQPTESREAFGRGDLVDWGEGQREATAGFVVCSPDCPDHWIDYVAPAAPVNSDPERPSTPEVTSWSADLGTVKAGAYVSYQDYTYLVKSSHTTQEEWSPTAMPALYEEVPSAQI